MKRRVLVIGFGSIGQRHARILEALGCVVGVVSRRAIERLPRFVSVEEGLAVHDPALVVIANETAAHRATLGELAAFGYTGLVLVEKPVVAASAPPVPRPTGPLYVGYNMRFHPLLRRLRELLAGKEALTAEVHVGQHLADWRPGRDYRKVYSASRAAGGGVLRDLSHELDYVAWLFGAWRRLAALGGRSGALDGDAEDRYALLLECESCPVVTVTLNMTDRPPRRSIAVTTPSETIVLDFVSGMLMRSGTKTPECARLDRDATYRAQWQALLADRPNGACTFEEGLAVVETIEAAERAVREQRWIVR